MKFSPMLRGFFSWLVLCLAAPFAQAAPDPSFHLYLLVGQSNMAGRGAVDEESKRADPRILMLTKTLEWQPATDPLHFDKPVAGVGPGLAFAKAMAAKAEGVRIGLIPCAVGGTSIKLWVPGAFDTVTRTHPYSDMLDRVRAAQKEGVLTGILWHQGEADQGAADAYAGLLGDLIRRLRADCGEDVPFVAGEISSFKSNSTEGARGINAAIRSLEGKVGRFGWVSSEGLSHKGDEVHYDAAAARVLGARYAERMAELCK